MHFYIIAKADLKSPLYFSTLDAAISKAFASINSVSYYLICFKW